jgi:hypothetical protein
MTQTPVTDAPVVPHDRFRLGTGYVDEETGAFFNFYSPAHFSDEWHAYLEHAESIYRERGLGDASWRTLEDGDGVPLFVVASLADGTRIGGIRFHGPLQSAAESAALIEMVTSPEIDALREDVASRISAGVLEMKGMWALGRSVTGFAIGDALVRTHLVAMEWLGSKCVYSTTAERQIELTRRCGVAKVWPEAVYYPDERYKTVAVRFEYERTLEICTPGHRAAYRHDLAQLEAASAIGPGVKCSSCGLPSLARIG